MGERRFGILIASSRFPQEPKLTSLRCPENDVDGLDKMLASKDRGEFSEVLVYKNRPHHEILRSINRVLRHATKDDLVPCNILSFVCRESMIYWRQLNRGGRHVAKISSNADQGGAQRA
jgi:hypothetical protein